MVKKVVAIKEKKTSAKKEKKTTNNNSTTQNKKILFSEDENFEDIVDTYENQNLQSLPLQTINNDEDDNDEVEIIHSSDVSIQKLKEMHELLLNKDIVKKRKVRERTQYQQEDLDKPLDIETLNSTNLDNIVVDNKNSDINSKHIKITVSSEAPKLNHFKKFGHIEVLSLDDKTDILDSFQVSNSASEFLSSLHSSHQRISHSRLNSFKNLGPAKVFKTK